jgi:2-polyprenyl-3-methyl-5-hydroxy-6-metoxy-1,4-benzoquinol methylase
MDSNCCNSYQKVFNDKWAKKDLKKYEKKGLKKLTGMLVEAIRQRSESGMTLLDIGGGIGTISFELLKDCVERSTHVDISEASLSVLKRETERRELVDKINILEGDFLDHADKIDPSDIVTLDKVICCYDDYRSLVNISASKANALYGFVIPRDTWWVKAVHIIATPFMKWFYGFQAYIHPFREIEAIVKAHGFQRKFRKNRNQWMVTLYSKT